jgi:agmatine/peptidylarginine deiminase
MPREAALDSEFLTVVAQLGQEQAQRVHTGIKQKTPSEFISKLRLFMRTGDIATEVEANNEDEHMHLDWKKTGELAAGYFKRTPSLRNVM